MQILHPPHEKSGSAAVAGSHSAGGGEGRWGQPASLAELKE